MESRTLAREMGKTETPNALIGEAYRLQGEDREATQEFSAGLSIALENSQWQTVAFCIRGLAALALAQGKEMRAARLMGAAEVIFPAAAMEFFSTTVTYRQDLASLRAMLGETRFESSWAEGQAMSLEQAVAYALERVTDA
ncbi:MAG: hypothetical protein HY326_10145, partial [Chloroflexi bacterium]|nr:hypothetical protein [Chloroflexota bacterium]